MISGMVVLLASDRRVENEPVPELKRHRAQNQTNYTARFVAPSSDKTYSIRIVRPAAGTNYIIRRVQP